MEHEPKVILVTGGLGFIGAHCVRYYLANPHMEAVVNLDKITYAADPNRLGDFAFDKRYHFVKGDLSDPHCLSKIFAQFPIDTVIHFAAESHVDNSINAPQDFMQSNVVGTATLLAAAKNHWIKWKGNFRFHHISTDEVYGSLGINAAPFTENAPYAPNSPYAASKAASDHWVRAYHQTYGMPVTISHTTNNYGENQHPEKWIPKIIQRAQMKQPISVYGKGAQLRSWIHVCDHIAGVDAIIRHGKSGETYHLSDNVEISNLALANLICDKLDLIEAPTMPRRSLIEFVPDRAGHDFRYALDSQKASTTLKWRPTINFEAGLSALLKGSFHFACGKTSMASLKRG